MYLQYVIELERKKLLSEYRSHDLPQKTFGPGGKIVSSSPDGMQNRRAPSPSRPTPAVRSTPLNIRPAYQPHTRSGSPDPPGTHGIFGSPPSPSGRYQYGSPTRDVAPCSMVTPDRSTSPVRQHFLQQGGTPHSTGFLSSGELSSPGGHGSPSSNERPVADYEQVLEDMMRVTLQQAQKKGSRKQK